MKNEENKKLKLQVIECIDACDEEFGNMTDQYKKILKQVKNSVIFTNPKHTIKNLNYPTLPFEDYIFDALLAMCYSAGGDGEVALISPYYKAWATNFEEYIKTIENVELQKSDDDSDRIIFFNSYESISFINHDVKDDPQYCNVGSCDGRLIFLT